MRIEVTTRLKIVLVVDRASRPTLWRWLGRTAIEVLDVKSELPDLDSGALVKSLARAARDRGLRWRRVREVPG